MTDDLIREADSALANLRQAEAGLGDLIRVLVAARERLSQAGPHDRDAAERHLAACMLQVRMDAAVLAHHLVAIATPAGAAAA